MTAPPRMQRIPGLDGLRGLAILLVMIHHLAVFIPRTPTEQIVFDILFMGWIGVDLFFVLSGMLITDILLETRDDPLYYRNFFVRRTLRIFPIYYALLIFSFYVLPRFTHPKIANFSRVDGYEFWYWLLLQNFPIAEHGPQHGIMDVTWSLAIEEQFYLVWPFLIRHLSASRLAAACLAIVAISPILRAALVAAGVDTWAVYAMTPTRLDGLAAGALVAMTLRSQPDRKVLAQRADFLMTAGAVGLAITALTCGGLPQASGLVTSIGFSIVVMMFSGLVMRVASQAERSRPLDMALRWRPLIILGTISYGLYLVHLPLRALVRDTIMRPAHFPDWPGGPIVAQLVFYVVAGGLGVLVAWGMFHLLEKRVAALKHRLAPYSPPPTPANVAAPSATPAPRLSITAVILTHDEDIHLERCLASIGGLVSRVVVVDSFSTDGTIEIAERLGAEVLQHRWRNYADQFQWGVDAAAPTTDWILRIDADEYFEPALCEELRAILPTLEPDVAGIYLRRKVIFRDTWIRHGGYYPTYLLRLWRNGCGRIEQRWMDEHIVLTRGTARRSHADFVDHNLAGVTHWTDKHNRYTTRQMVDFLNLEYGFYPIDTAIDRETGSQARMKRFLRNRIFARAPLYVRGLLYFFQRYFLRLGFLDGRDGFVFHFLQGLWNWILIDAKIDEARAYIAAHGVEAFRARLATHYGIELGPAEPRDGA